MRLYFCVFIHKELKGQFLFKLSLSKHVQFARSKSNKRWNLHVQEGHTHTDTPTDTHTHTPRAYTHTTRIHTHTHTQRNDQSLVSQSVSCMTLAGLSVESHSRIT